jgi:hypothetical protein
MLMKIESLEDIVEKKANLLSGVTGLPITKKYADLIETVDAASMHYILALGTEYKIDIIDFTTVDDHGYEANINWTLTFNGRLITRKGFNIGSTYKNTPRNITFRNVSDCLGGVDSETAFMDYERYSSSSLEDNAKDSYFQNIYLMIMTHMKERGMKMPQILSKNGDVRKAMNSGKVEELKLLVRSAMEEEADSRCLAHMLAESEVLADQAESIRQRRDRSIDLFEKFTDLTVKKVPGEKILPPYNILVVENEAPFGHLTRLVAQRLASDGRYGATNLIMDYNLSACMQVCETGQISLVMFDWSTPSYEESLMFGGSADSIYKMLNGNSQGMIDLSGGNPMFSRKDGREFNLDELKEEAEQVDVRNEWMALISRACSAANVSPPPHHIVRSEREFPYLDKIVSLKLGNMLNH